MHKEAKVIIGNVCFIFDTQDRRVLLLKRNRQPMKGMYTGVGGKAEWNEDVRLSCFREVKEETELEISKLTLRGIIKTIYQAGHSSWILFVFTAQAHNDQFGKCDEGTLEWVDRQDVASYPLIGFIKEIIPFVLDGNEFVEGTIFHDDEGNVIDKQIALRTVK